MIWLNRHIFTFYFSFCLRSFLYRVLLLFCVMLLLLLCVIWPLLNVGPIKWRYIDDKKKYFDVKWKVLHTVCVVSGKINTIHTMASRGNVSVVVLSFHSVVILYMNCSFFAPHLCLYYTLSCLCPVFYVFC